MRVLVTVLISALLPISPTVQEAAELLRQAAITAGCPKPVLEMRWLGEDRQVEIYVRCEGEAK